tara:strand:- start:9597 stop:9866 length:270 start_codon:yes stop_codon:yes gene_type:complete
MLEYKGYHGKVEFDEEAGLFHGEVVGLRDVITFQGKSVDELEQVFRDSIDDYLDFCQELIEAERQIARGEVVSHEEAKKQIMENLAKWK